MSDRSDLASALLSADAAGREHLLRSVDPETLEMALPHIGRRRDVAAAEVLALIDVTVEDKAVRKAARRELHRLRSVGVAAPEAATLAPTAPSTPHADVADTAVSVADARATDIDPSGTRALWITGDRRLGGIWFGAMLLNDVNGLEDMNLIDTTRKRYVREWESVRTQGATWVDLPGTYALSLVREAVDLSRANDRGLPRAYRGFKDAFGEASAGPERALIYETISPVEVEFNPTWLEESPGLLTQPELRGWHVAIPADMRQQALEVARSQGRGLVVPGQTPEGQALALVAQASQRAISPELRRALRRRLEETAYIFSQTERLSEARSAVAAAHALEETAHGPRVAPERHPLVRMLIAAGLGRLLGTERIGGRLAAEVLLEMIERAADSGGPGSGAPVETRPSGLILPR